MKIRMTFDVDDQYRLGVRRGIGQYGKATYDEVRQHLLCLFEADVQDQTDVAESVYGEKDEGDYT